VVLDFDGIQVEVCHWKLDELSIGWEMIDTTAAITGWGQADFTPVWSHADERLRPFEGRELREAAFLEWRPSGRDLAAGTVAVEFAFGSAGCFRIANGLDENRIETGTAQLGPVQKNRRTASRISTCRPPIAASASVLEYRLWTRPDTLPHFGHAAVAALALASTSSSPAATVTSSTTTPASCGRRTPRSTEPGHDKNAPPCDNDTTDSWKSSRLRQPLDYQEAYAKLRLRPCSGDVPAMAAPRRSPAWQ
jgi:hypothetical protein